MRAVNDSAARLFDADVTRMLGTPVLRIIPPEQRAGPEQAFRKALEFGQATEFEITDRDRGGAPRELAFTVSPIVDDHGLRLGVSVFARDITPRLRAADDSAHARKMASLSQLAGGLAHRFNNILGGIVTSVDFALASDEPGKHRRVLEQTAASLTRATRLMESLLAFAEGDQRPTDLADLTETLIGVSERIRPELAAAHVELELVLNGLPVMPVRRLPLEHVLMTLIHNAVEAMPRGGRLTIRTRREADRAIVEVSDTGRGIPPQDIEHLFEPFFSTKHAGVGEASHRGLGLAVVHGVVQFMGGVVRVSSKVGEGTVFLLELPIPEQQ
jgi:PAS domain S-box-containing protein